MSKESRYLRLFSQDLEFLSALLISLIFISLSVLRKRAEANRDAAAESSHISHAPYLKPGVVL